MSDRSIGSEFKISVLFGLAVCLTTGCGDKSGNVSLSPVTGTVVYKGQPIERGTIVFYPESGRSAAGVITDGEIAEVMTYEPGDGAARGKVKVTVTAFDNPDADMYTPKKSLIPTKYNSPETTSLEAVIEPGPNEFNSS